MTVSYTNPVVLRARNKLSAPSYTLSPLGLTGAPVHSRWVESAIMINLAAGVSKEAPLNPIQARRLRCCTIPSFFW